MFIVYLFYSAAMIAGGAWSILLLVNAENAVEIQAAMTPMVIAYLIAECLSKAVAQLTRRKERDDT